MFIAIIPTHLLCQMWANPPEAEFQVTISKLRKRYKISSLLVYVLLKTRNKAFPRRCRVKTRKKCTKKVWCTCEVVVLLIKPFVFFTFSLPSASLDLKSPYCFSTGTWLKWEMRCIHSLLPIPSALLHKRLSNTPSLMVWRDIGVSLCRWQ